MTTFTIDPPLLAITAQRFRKAGSDAEDLAVRLADQLQRVRLLLASSPGIASDIPRQLDGLAETWNLVASSLLERLVEFDAIAIRDLAECQLTEQQAALFKSDLVADIAAEVQRQVTDGINSAIVDLVANTEPVIIRSAQLRYAGPGGDSLLEGSVGPRNDGLGDPSPYFFFVEDGRRQRVTIDDETGTITTRDGRSFSVIEDAEGEFQVLLEGQTAVQRVVANLGGNGDGTTPTIEALTASLLGLDSDSIEDPRTDDPITGDRPPDDGGPSVGGTFNDEEISVSITFGNSGVPEIDQKTGDVVPPSVFEALAEAGVIDFSIEKGLEAFEEFENAIEGTFLEPIVGGVKDLAVGAAGFIGDVAADVVGFFGSAFDALFGPAVNPLSIPPDISIRAEPEPQPGPRDTGDGTNGGQVQGADPGVGRNDVPDSF